MADLWQFGEWGRRLVDEAICDSSVPSQALRPKSICYHITIAATAFGFVEGIVSATQLVFGILVVVGGSDTEAQCDFDIFGKVLLVQCIL